MFIYEGLTVFFFHTRYILIEREKKKIQSGMSHCQDYLLFFF